MTTSPPHIPAPADDAEAEARVLDFGDPLTSRRAEFAVPRWPGGRFPELAYFAGNSLGLQPLTVRQLIAEELDDWARLGVEGHEDARRPWLTYTDLLRGPAARIVGALPQETVAMNSLTVNLHLMMATFYRPQGIRTRILIEDSAFPSDSYAVRSQAVHHGLDPDRTVVRLRPRPGEHCLRTEDIEAQLARHGDRTALVLLGGVNYLTGELLDIERITAAGHAAGAVVGWDLAHAAGNVPLRLHYWDVDWAAWCSYKYLNSGPGSVAGCFVHERHAVDTTLPRLSGWFGHDLADRFRMPPVHRPTPTADAWQLSNPPILALAPVLASLRIFDQVGMAAIRERSLRLTGYLQRLLDGVTADRPLSVITPRDPRARGCQLSVRVLDGDAVSLARILRDQHGVVADVRQPDIIRFAPVPLYSTFHDCWRAAAALAQSVAREGKKEVRGAPGGRETQAPQRAQATQRSPGNPRTRGAPRAYEDRGARRVHADREVEEAEEAREAEEAKGAGKGKTERRDTDRRGTERREIQKKAEAEGAQGAHAAAETAEAEQAEQAEQAEET